MPDYELRNRVEEEMIRLGDEATEDQLYIYDKAWDDETDDEEHYELIYALAKELNIK